MLQAEVQKKSVKANPTNRTTLTTKTSPPKKTTVKPGTGSQRKPATAKTSIVKPSPAAKGSKKTGSKKAAPARRTSSYRAGQSTPTQDRYKDIQSELATRGYLKSEPNGQWGPESQEALKKFQQEQNLRPTGKLDSLSLISLGLGPKRTATALPRPQPTDGANNDNRGSQGSQRP